LSHYLFTKFQFFGLKSQNQNYFAVIFLLTYNITEKNGFVTATKLGTTNEFFVASTKNFAAATTRFVDKTKHFVAVTIYFCYQMTLLV